MSSPPSRSAGGDANEIIAPGYVARLLAEPTETEVWYLGLDSGRGAVEDEEKLVATMSGLVRAFGIDPDNWAQNYVARSKFRGYADVFVEHKKWLRLRPQLLGQYAIQTLLAELDIEGGEDDYADVEIDLALSSGRAMQIRGEGSYWTEYTFSNINPDDRRTFEGLINDGEETTDSEVCFRLGFHMVLLSQKDG